MKFLVYAAASCWCFSVKLEFL